MPHPHDANNSKLPNSEDMKSKFKKAGDWLKRKAAFDLRDQWWRLLDLIETNRKLRRTLYAVVVTVILTTLTMMWIYPWWNQRNVISIARGWLAAGRLDHAAEAVQKALEVAPERPESWQVAASLARLGSNKSRAVDCSRHAASLMQGNADLILQWAADALLDNQLEETERALATLPNTSLAASPYAQRMLGEIARRRGEFSTARTHFETALQLDGPLPIDEVPLGTILLNAHNEADRKRGLDLLGKWTTNVEWGANVLRTLLADALIHDDRPAMLRWADTLRAHPRCTLGDIPNCLLALSKTDEKRFAEVLAIMEKNHAGDSGNIALLLSWLNQIGRSGEAIQWVKKLPPALTKKLPASVGVSESFRQLADWSALLSWTRDADWGTDLESLRLAYALQAARQLNQTSLAQELWTTLQSRATSDGGRTLFTADTLYGWGLRDNAITLLWAIADQPEIAIQALGTLARHYQVERDATGQYRIFQRLHSLRADDPSIANNYAFFATLTGDDLRAVEQIASGNFKKFPDSVAYRATYALVLCTQNRATEALEILKPVADQWKNSSVIALPYGLALAGTQQKAEARIVLASLALDTLTDKEATLVKHAIN